MAEEVFSWLEADATGGVRLGETVNVSGSHHLLRLHYLSFLIFLVPLLSCSIRRAELVAELGEQKLGKVMSIREGFLKPVSSSLG